MGSGERWFSQLSWTSRKSKKTRLPSVPELVGGRLRRGDALRCPRELGDLPQVQMSAWKLGEVSAAASFGNNPLEGVGVVAPDIWRRQVHCTFWRRLVFKTGDERDRALRFVSSAVDTPFGEPDDGRIGPCVATSVFAPRFARFAGHAPLEGERGDNAAWATRTTDKSRARCEESHGR